MRRPWRSAWLGLAILGAVSPILVPGCTTSGGRRATPTEEPVPSATAIATATRTPTTPPTATPTNPPGGFLVAAGGFGSTSVSAVFVAQITPSGGIGPWVAQMSLPIDVGLFHGFADGGGFVSVGGARSPANTTLTDLFSAPVVGGAISSWGNTTALPLARYEYGLGVTGGFVHVAGGAIWNGAVTVYPDVWSAPLTGGGTVGTWTSGVALPSGRSHCGSATDGSYLYLCGGYNASGGTVAQVNVGTIAGGAITGWTTSTSLPAAMAGTRAFVDGGNLFVFGGGANAVFAAPVSGGSVGSWVAQSPLPATRWFPGVAVGGGFVYSVGSYGGAGNASVYYAPLSGGTLGSWTSTTPLPAGAGGIACAVVP